MVDLNGVKIKATVYDSEDALQSFKSYTLPNTPFYFSLQWENLSLQSFFSSKEVVWDFGDGDYATGPTASHYYKWPGKYKVKATLTDLGGNPNEIFLESDLVVENVMPDAVSFKNFLETTNAIYKIPAGKRSQPLELYRFNSWQNDAVFREKNYTINLFASGGKSNYMSVSSYYDSKWSHLKPYFGFVEYSVDETGIIKQKIIESTQTTSVSVYAEKMFDSRLPINERWNIRLNYYPFPKEGTAFCGTSGQIPENKTIHFIEQKPCKDGDLTDVIFLYAYPDTRQIVDKDSFKYELDLANLPNGFVNYPWNTKIVQTTFNPASSLKFSSNGITLDGPSVEIGPLSGQFIYSFDIYPLKWAFSKIPFVVSFADNENYVIKNYPQIQSFTVAPTSPSQVGNISVFLMEYIIDTTQTTLTSTPEYIVRPVDSSDYVILNSSEVPHFENGCYFAGVLSANRQIDFAFLSAIAMVQDLPPTYTFPGYVYIFQPGQSVFRRYEREFVYDHTNKEQLVVNFKDVLTSYTYAGSGGVNITYAPLRSYDKDTKDYVWVTDADKDTIYVFDQDGSPINNSYESNRLFAGYTNRINTGRFRLIRPGKLAPEPGFINARGLINADKVSSSPCQVAVNGEGDAWISLYDSISSFKFNKDNFYATAVAVPNPSDSLTPKILNYIDVSFNAAYTEFLNKQQLPYTRALSYAQSGIDNFTTIIRNGPDAAPRTSPGRQTNSDRQAVKELFKANRALVQNRVIRYVNGTFFNVLTSTSLSDKCFRDSGYITDSIAADVDNNTNHRSVDVGLIYFSGPVYETGGGSSVPTLPTEQVFATAATISSIGPIMAEFLPYRYFSFDEQFMLSGYDSIARIVNDKNSVPATYPNGQPPDSTYQQASNFILNQKDLIQQKTIEFVRSNFPSALSSSQVGESEALTAKCFRDSGFIVESIAADIANNANHRSVETGIFYLSGAVLGVTLTGTNIPTLPSSQINATIAAISAIGSFITGLTIPVTETYSLNGILSSSIFFTDSQNKLIDSFNNFITIIDDKESAPKTKPNGLVTDFTFLTASSIIKNYKEAIQLRTVQFVQTLYPFALSGSTPGSSEALSAKCFRDSGFIIDSLIADIANNANHRSVETGMFYFSGAILAREYNLETSVPTLPQDQVFTTIAAISAIGSFITGLTMPPEKTFTTRGVLSTNEFLTNEQLKAVDLLDTFSQTIQTPLSTILPPPKDPAPFINTVPPPNVTPYTTFGSNPPNLYPSLFVYEGRNVAILAENNFFNPFIYQKIINFVGVLDNSVDQLIFFTGDQPQGIPGSTYNNKTIIASVSSTCDEVCSLLGNAGIEITKTVWDNLYVSNLITNDNNIYSQLLFYGLSRNFWLYNSQLYSNTLPFFPEAYALYNSFVVMEKLSLSGAPYIGSTSFNEYKSIITQMVDTYINGAYDWSNTFELNEGVTNTLGLTGANYLMASILFDLKNRFGEILIDRLWRKVGEKSPAITDQDIVDNFIISCCETVNLNLVELFEEYYRWPVSSKVEDTVRFLPTAKSLLIYPTVYPITEDRSEARYDIIRFKPHIQRQVVEYVKAISPAALSGSTPGSSEALSAQCFRFAGYVIDAISDDILYGVNYRSIETGAAYYDGITIPRLFDDSTSVLTITAIGAYITGIDVPQIPTPFTFSGILTTGKTSTQILSVLDRVNNLIFPFKENTTQQTYIPELFSTQKEKDLANTIITNKLSIQQAVSSYVIAKQLLNPSVSGEFYDIGFMVDAISYDLDKGFNARSTTYAFTYWGENIPLQKDEAVDVVEQLKSVVLNFAVNSSEENENLALKKINNLIYTLTYPLNTSGSQIPYNPLGSPTDSDVLLGNTLIANKTSIQRSVSSYVFAKNYLTISPLTSSLLTNKCNRDVGFMLDAVANDLITGVNSKSIQYAIAYWDGNTSRLPETEIPNQKANTLDTIRVLQSYALDVAVNNSQLTENLALKKIKNLAYTVSYPIETGGASLPYNPAGAPLTLRRTQIANLLLENKSTLQAKVSAYVTGNSYLTAGTIFSEKCTRDAGFMVDAVVSDILNGVVAKSIQYGLAYWDGSTTRLPSNIIPDQILKTVDTVKFLKTQSIDTVVQRTSADNIIVNDLFRLSRTVAFPLLNDGNALPYIPQGEPLTDARQDAYNRLISNRERIQAVVKEFVDNNIPLDPIRSAKCNRDVGLMVDAIANDILTGVMSRSIQYALAYWEGSVSRLTEAVPGQNELTAQTVEFLGQVIINIINEVINYPTPNAELFGGPGFEYDDNSGFTGENTILPTAVDVDKDNNVYIAYSHPLNSFVVKYDSDGNQLAIIALPRFTTPQQLLVDLNNDLWIGVLNTNSVFAEEDPQISQMPPFINNRNDYIFYFKSDFTRTFRREFPLVGDMTMDRNGAVWFNSGINQLTKIDNRARFETYILGNPASSLSYVQDFGGIAGDINGFMWVINNAESKLMLYNTDDPKSQTVGEITSFVLPEISETISPEEQFSFYLTTGDFSGIRWILKYRPNDREVLPRTVDGGSNLFTIRKPSSFIVKKNENFDLNAKIKSFVLQEKLRESNVLFDEFTEALLNGDNKTTSELGKVIYERITNYVNNHSDIDLCSLQSLESMYKQLGFMYRKYFNLLPVNVRRVFDLLSINQRRLFGSTNTFNRNFVLSSYFLDIKNNLGKELSISEDTFIVGHPIIAYEYFSGKYTLVTNTMISELGAEFGKPYPLSGVNYDWGWGLVLGSQDQRGEEVKRYYKFYEFVPQDRSDEVFDNIIDFTDSLTTITVFNSSYNDWVKYGGYMDNAISSMLYEGLELY